MGMRLDPGSVGRSGGGCRSGMADSSNSPRLAALRGLEESLRWHREAQASPASARAADRTGETAPAQAHASEEPDDLFADDIVEAPAHPIRRGRIALPEFFRGSAVRRALVTVA